MLSGGEKVRGEDLECREPEGEAIGDANVKRRRYQGLMLACPAAIASRRLSLRCGLLLPAPPCGKACSRLMINC